MGGSTYILSRARLCVLDGVAPARYTSLFIRKRHMATDNQALAPETATAAQTLSRRQRARLCLYAMAMAAFFLWDYKIAFTALTLALCVFYGMAVGVRLLSAWLARRRPAALAAAPEDMASIPDNEWPVYTILVPL